MAASACARSRSPIVSMHQPMFHVAIAASLALAVSFPVRADFTGKVVVVADGDSVTVLRDREQVKVRLVDIDAPERAQPYGNRSKQALELLLKGQQVRVVEHGKDRYHRTLGTGLSRRHRRKCGAGAAGHGVGVSPIREGCRSLCDRGRGQGTEAWSVARSQAGPAMGMANDADALTTKCRCMTDRRPAPGKSMSAHPASFARADRAA